MASEFLKRMAAQERQKKLEASALPETETTEGAATAAPKAQPSAFLQRMVAQERERAAAAQPSRTPSSFLQQMAEQEKQRNAEINAYKTQIGYDETTAQAGYQRYLSDRAEHYYEGQYDTEPSDRWSAEQRNIFGHLYMTSPSEAGSYAKKVNAGLLNAQEATTFREKYHDYEWRTQSADFEEKSKYVPQERTERRWIDLLLDNYSDDASGWEDPLYEAINGNEEARAYLQLQGQNYYGEQGGALGAIYGGKTESKAEAGQMTKKEIAIFNYLYATEGKAAAHGYYNFIRSELYARHREEGEAYWKEYAEKDPIGSSVFSVAVSPLRGLSYLGQVTDYLTTGKVDQNAP